MEDKKVFKIILHSIDEKKKEELHNAVIKIFKTDEETTRDILGNLPIALIDSLSRLEAAIIAKRLKDLTNVGAVLKIGSALTDIPMVDWKGNIPSVLKVETVAPQETSVRCPKCEEEFIIRYTVVEKKEPALVKKEKMDETKEPPLVKKEESAEDVPWGEIPTLEEFETSLRELLEKEEPAKEKDIEELIPEEGEAKEPTPQALKKTASSQARLEDKKDEKVEAEPEEIAPVPVEPKKTTSDELFEELFGEKDIDAVLSQKETEPLLSPTQKGPLKPKFVKRPVGPKGGFPKKTIPSKKSAVPYVVKEKPKIEENSLGSAEKIFGLTLPKISSRIKKETAARIISEETGIDFEEAYEMTHGFFVKVVEEVTQKEAEALKEKFKAAGIASKITRKKK